MRCKTKQEEDSRSGMPRRISGSISGLSSHHDGCSGRLRQLNSIGRSEKSGRDK